MNWYQIKKNIYYSNDDYVRDIIALHLKNGALKAIYNYICQTSLVSMEERFKGIAEDIEHDVCNEIITLFLCKKPVFRWYLNSAEQLEMDIDARFVDSLNIHNTICEFLTNLSCLIDEDIFLLDDVIKEKSLVLMVFKPQAPPEIIEGTKSIEIPSCL
ncbi:hypothetical protein [Prevotella fusca]|uniref:Uncharacterized protein n=1 Tax=Prevotella fusca JCM 17724 TaxID=1236517 RepID=A0A0K1NJF5_9BACT|nr:hypothetical protein [Prevotella fusca]AKU68816.1 hypothetical protein ADJ77_03010 [Prevotella fusca JCM 17724]QUB86440.1 hypothetical protein J5A51_10135 [Prevotella fusca JCM 17724]